VAAGALTELEGVADEDAAVVVDVPIAALLEVDEADGVAGTNVSYLAQASPTGITILTCSIRILAIECDTGKWW
jgi:hypothetical protein